MRKLLLFDIDDTLLARTNGHLEAFSVAFQQVYGVYASGIMVKYHGRTDQQIIEEVLLKCGIDKEVIKNKMTDAMQVMCDYFEAIEPYITVETFPGVAETLATLDTPDNILGLVTGNLERIAHGKLASAGIDGRFQLGGFGNDHGERAELVEKAKERASQQFGFTEEEGGIYLFGDATHDMRAAKAGGAEAIGVTTGAFTAEELHEAGADQVISGVSDQAEVLAALGLSKTG